MSENNSISADALQATLESFNQPEVVSVARNPMQPRPEPENEGEYELEEETTEEHINDTEDTEETDVETSEEEETSVSFNEQFKEAFGMEPTEAVELVNDLQNFKQEMLLMREWGVSPSEYDSRITSVKEFYSGLPEDKREQFNNPEGVKAIWNHLEKTGNKSKGKTPNRTRGTLSKAKGSKQPEMLKRSEIIAMDDSTYKKNYRKISLAFAENRVIEDV